MTIQFPPPMVQQPPVGQGLLITKVSRSHSVWHIILDRIPLDEWSARRRDLTWQHTALTRDRYPCPCGIRNHRRSKGGAADPRLKTARPLGSVDNPTGYVITSLTFLHNFEQSSSTRTCFTKPRPATYKRNVPIGELSYCSSYYSCCLVWRISRPRHLLLRAHSIAFELISLLGLYTRLMALQLMRQAAFFTISSSSLSLYHRCHSQIRSFHVWININGVSKATKTTPFAHNLQPVQFSSQQHNKILLPTVTPNSV